ncbi:MBOAT family O-acyltransferase [Wenyingzhuangia sp. IMCC45533]
MSIIANIGLLFFFKYCNFFINSFTAAFPFLANSNSLFSLNIILPVGISFYTFQTLSYNIDVYRNKLKPTNDFIAFAAFVSFFPQLVAGPIERATHLLPQFLKNREFSSQLASTGVKLIAWGFFKKLVIADNASIIVDGIFSHYHTQTSTSLIVGSILFAFQIYGDFSGYSDIAIGLARLFGFDLMTNFRFPYLSTNISEFWKRWHISLSTWFRDYLYIPLGGSKTTKQKAIRNITIVFVASGFWHGANWTFLMWGVIHAILYIPLFLGSKLNLPNFLKSIWTFVIVTFAWVFFRAKNITTAFDYISLVFYNNNTKNFYLSTRKYLLITSISLGAILLMLLVEYYFNKKDKKEIVLSNPWTILIIIITVFLGAFKNHASFIYFQF